jgi:hypothetical protein
MTKFFAGVLSVIALGVMLIAYGLLSPRATAFTNNAPFGATPVSQRVMAPDGSYGVYGPTAGYAPYGAAYPSPAYGYADLRYPQPPPYGYAGGAAYPAMQVVREVQPVQTVVRTQAAPRRTTVIERPRRNWKKTALVIGGSTAAGAGVGGAIGGKKGALIGAALGGGASSLYEATRK